MVVMVLAHLILLLLYTQSLLRTGLGFKWGAPFSACKDMRPQHGYTPHFEDFPYGIDLKYADSLKTYRRVVTRRKVLVILYSKNPDVPFKGFFAMSQDLDHKPFGRFLKSEQISLLDCYYMKQSAATHTDAIPVTNVTLKWLPPRKPVRKSREVYFMATFVQNLDHSWVGVKSKKFYVRKKPKYHPIYNYESIFNIRPKYRKPPVPKASSNITK